MTKISQFRHPLPTLAELGRDMTVLTRGQRARAIAQPFLYVTGYFTFACAGWWVPAILAIAAYTFVSYGSTSHDLVHNNLGLPRRLNRGLLSLIELLGLRSGHAYRAAHLHHHRQFPDHDDVEGAAAHGSIWAATLAGPLHQFRVWRWALGHYTTDRTWIVIEGIGCLTILATAFVAAPYSVIPLVYVILVVMGSWTFPLITSYLPHNPGGVDALHQTRRIRGKVADFIFRRHYYHLEHHLYPRVPHQNWAELASRLDPYLDRAGIVPIYFGF